MELVGRMMDGSIPEPRPGGPRGGFFGFRVRQDEKIARLAEVPLLEGCTRGQLKAVARIAEIREVPAGTVLTRAGERGEEFFLLMDGKARVEISPRKRVTLAPGDFFGEMSLLDGEPRSATVTTETAARLLVIRRRDFARLLREVPELTRAILAVLCRRLRQAEQAPTA
ncbi:MAG TPA: cyclic nucleotide-binding domain-containing protein [Calidithermus sp.]|nr:cyclic nucleotide-binding domain-containing protein [Calidithermus sp.]